MHNLNADLTPEWQCAVCFSTARGLSTKGVLAQRRSAKSSEIHLIVKSAWWDHFLANYTDFLYAFAFSLKPPKPSVAPFDISQTGAPLFFNELPLNVHTCYEPTSSSESDPTAAKRFLRPSSLFFYFSFCESFAACFIFVCRGLLRSFSVVFYAFCCYFVKRLGAAVKKSVPWMKNIAVFDCRQPCTGLRLRRKPTKTDTTHLNLKK